MALFALSAVGFFGSAFGFIAIFLTGMLVRKVLIKFVVIAGFITLIYVLYQSIQVVLDSFLPGGTLAVVFPGGAPALELLSYVIPSNTGACITAILLSYATLFLYRYSVYFLNYLAS